MSAKVRSLCSWTNDLDGDQCRRTEIFVVPRGLERCLVAAEEASSLMFEPTGTRHTGDSGGDRTREADELR